MKTLDFLESKKEEYKNIPEPTEEQRQHARKIFMEVFGIDIKDEE